MELQLWVVFDASGEYVVSKECESEAWELHAEDIGGSEPKRSIKVTLTVPVPVPISLKGTVPAESQEGTLVIDDDRR